MFSEALTIGAPVPIGLWDFDDPQALLRATLGQDLRLRGQQNAIAGVQANDGAVRIGVGSQYVCDHGLAPKDVGSLGSRFSLLYDFRCFFPSNPADRTEPSAPHTQAGAWQRLVVAVDNLEGAYRLYLDGERILSGTLVGMEGPFSLAPTVWFFANEPREHAGIDVTRLAIFDTALSAAEVAELGPVARGDPSNLAPVAVPHSDNSSLVQAGETASFQFAADDPEQTPVQLRIDWGDGEELSPWSSLAPSGQPVAFAHTYRQPGGYGIRTLARDVAGQLSTWTDVQSVTVTGVAQVAFRTPVYLQNVRPDGITLMWELDRAVGAVVEYGLGTHYGASATGVSQASGAGTYVYRCVLRSLAPGTRYYFRCRAGNQERVGTFATAPAGEADFAFSVWGDSQGSNHGAYNADPLQPTKNMFRHMATNGLQLAVTVGDLAESGYAYSDVRQYYLDRAAALLGPSVPWFVAWGNHDGGADAVIRKFADLPSRDRAGFGPGHGSFSFDFGGCHFICLDESSRTSDVLNWLENDLRSAANRNAKFTFLFVHVPPYCELWIDGDALLRNSLVPLMETYGVDVCFSGHTHEYSRGFRNGVYYCITGGGSWLDSPEVLVRDWEHMTVGGYHAIPGVTKPGPNRGGGLINEYVRVEVRGDAFTASMIGFRPDGTVVGVLDQFGKSRLPASQPPATPQVTGPAEVNVLTNDTLVLHSSAFSDPDPQDTHQQCVWRLSRSTNLLDASAIMLEGVTGPGQFAWPASVSNLWPGLTLFASVRHIASDGQASEYAAPIPIRLLPDPIYHEDFESAPEFSLPPGWAAQHRTSVDLNTSDAENPRSNTYLTWTVVSYDRLARVFGANRVNVVAAVQGKSVYAESDHRSGVQLQYLITPDFDLTGVTHVLLMFRSNYLQNQDSLGALEYSLDGGFRWLPVVYLLDASDIVAAANGQGPDARATFTRVDDSAVPTADGRSASGGTYGEHILSRPFESLAGFIDARINDDPVESKRIERFRLAAADGQARVRFRFTLVGTASWFWGLDDFSLYGTRGVHEPFRIVRVHYTAQGVELEWTGPRGPFQLERQRALGVGPWEAVGEIVEPDGRTFLMPLSGQAGFYRVRLAR
jgi:hypothetical protein